jgi:hypothetical protein
MNRSSRNLAMVLEGLVTTINDDGSLNAAPMGPLVDSKMTQFVLRPYRTSRTYVNLKRAHQGVLHVTDDVEMLAQAALGRLQNPRVVPAKRVEGAVLADACRWYEFRVDQLDDRAARTTIACRVVQSGRIRDFFGLNRAMGAVLEAAILATRLELLPPEAVLEEFRRLAVPVEKTSGPRERRAFEFLRRYVDEYYLKAAEET